MNGLAGAWFTLAISIVLPLGVLLYFILRKRWLVAPFLLGVLTFTLSQLITRIPLLYLLNGQPWYQNFAAGHAVVYGILLALSAGIFEECGRWLVMRFMMKRNRSFSAGVAFGLGHGGWEALTIVGTQVGILLLVAPSLLQMESFMGIALAGIERVGAIILQTALSLVVLWGVRTKSVKPLLLAILLHALVDSTVVLLPLLGVSEYALIAVLFVWALAISAFVYKIRHKIGWGEKYEKAQKTGVPADFSLDDDSVWRDER